MQAGVVGTGREGPGGTCAVVTAPGSAVHPAPSPQTCVCPWLVLLGGGSPSGRGAVSSHSPSLPSPPPPSLPPPPGGSALSLVMQTLGLGI